MNKTIEYKSHSEEEVLILKAQPESRRERKEILHAINNLPDGMIFHSVRDVNTGVLRFDYVSGTCEKLLGVSEEDIYADIWNFFAHFEQEGLKEAMQHIRDSIELPDKFDFELRYRHPVTKTEHWIQISFYPHREGDFVYAHGFIFDITARKQTEQKLIIEKERLERLGNHLPDGALYQFVQDDLTGQVRISFVSGNWETITGIPAEAAINNIDLFFAMIHPDDLPVMMQTGDNTVETMENFYGEFRITVHGKTRWIQMRSHTSRRDASVVWDGIILDITRRKEIGHELELEKNRLQMLSNNIPDGTFYQFILNTQTAQMSLLYVSETWEMVTGIPADKVIGDISNLFNKVHPDDLSALIQSIEDSARTMTDHKFEMRLNGRWASIVARPRREGLFIVWDGIGTNITERKETERELKAAKDRLQALSDNIPGGALFQLVRDTCTRGRRMSYVSTTWETVTGIPADVVLADITKLYSTIPSDEFPAYLQALDESARNMTDVNLEVHFKNRLMQVIARPNREGTLIFWNGIITDITERKNRDAELSKYRDHLEQLVNERTVELHTALEEIQASNEELFVTNEHLNNKNVQLAEEMTARMEATKQLEENEKKLKSFFSQSSEGIIIINNEGLVIEWNPEQENITGIPREKAIGQYCWDLYRMVICEKNADEMVDQFRNLLFSSLESAQKGEKCIKESELELCPPGESTKYIVVTTFPIKHGDRYYLGQVVRDITLQKLNDKELEQYRTQLENMVEQKVQELAQSHQAMHAVLDNLDIHIVVTDFENYEILFANKKAKELFGDIDGKKCWQVIQKGMTGPCEFCPKNNLINKHDCPTGVYTWEQLNTVDHEWYSCRDAAVEWIDGRTVRIEYATNITRQKKDEAELTKYRENLENLVQKRTDQLNVSNEELYAANEELKEINTQLDKEIKSRMEYESELEQYRSQLENMVEQRTKELMHAKEKAEESDKLKSAFLANMSHEIRTPLNGIVGFLRFIDSDNLSPERRREYIDIVNNSSMQLMQIINDIIDVSKIEANQMNINPVPVNLNELMNELHMFFETFLQSKNKEHVELILDDSGFIDNCVVYMDSTRLRQILTNLIGNAVKFTEKGYIRFGYRKSAPDFLEFVVEDSGIGLRDDQQEVIFERFRQAEIENRNHYGGTGLGLTISKSLVEMKGGRMWVESSEGKGASFYFSISYLPVLSQDMKLFKEMPDNNSSDEKPFANKSVLLVEPVALKFKYYDKLISSTGASVIHTKSMKKWHELMQTDIHFDVVIADASLLDREDINNISQIVNVRPNLPVVLIVSDKRREKYMRLVRGKLCKTAVEIPVVYADVMKILEKYAK